MPSKDQTKQKIINHIDYCIDTSPFQNKIKEIRKKLKIPLSGLEIRNKEINSEKLRDYLYIPIKYDLGKSEYRDNLELDKQIEEAITEILPINEVGVILKCFFRFYIFHNKKMYETIESLLIGSSYFNIQGISLCEIDDFHYIKPLKKTSLIKRFEFYPTIIKINPSASQRDIIGFIKSNWDRIEAHQKKNKNFTQKIKSLRNKNIAKKKRNNFIYQNRHLPIKQIFKMVSDEFGEVLDDGHIGKILSLEKKRRKEV